MAKGKDLFTLVGPNCSSLLIIIPAGTSVHSSAAIMALKQVKRLSIVKDEKLIGIITARDS